MDRSVEMCSELAEGGPNMRVLVPITRELFRLDLQVPDSMVTSLRMRQKVVSRLDGLFERQRIREIGQDEPDEKRWAARRGCIP